ncbi:tectonic-like complex member MKS1 isoform X1 [Tachypleus tridentatus]|uniref:tectonic-like complex member MKS1 isoform X1 n=1 Tax=Tachypleus tridentatus TaxID=6853 RepID=UPI003FD04A2B
MNYQNKKVEKHPPGIYRTHDPIQNLKIRVYLEKLVASSVVKEAQIEEENSGTELQQLRLKKELKEELIVKWQEKCFSQRELDKYCEERNLHTFLERKYHQQVLGLESSSNRKTTSHLFTYVDADIANEFLKWEEPATTSHTDVPSFLAKKMQNLQLRQGFLPGDKKKLQDVPCGSHIVVSSQANKDGHLLTAPTRRMWIMADIRPDDCDTCEEVILCSIGADTNGVLIVSPDFNFDKEPYIIQNSSGEEFKVIIQHASEKISKEEKEREKSMLFEVSSVFHIC